MRRQGMEIQGVDGAGEGEVGGLDKLGPEVAVRLGALCRPGPLPMAYFFVVCHYCRDGVWGGWCTGVLGGGGVRGRHVMRERMGRLSVGGRGWMQVNRCRRPRSFHEDLRDALMTCTRGLSLLYRASEQCFKSRKG